MNHLRNIVRRSETGIQQPAELQPHEIMFDQKSAERTTKNSQGPVKVAERKLRYLIHVEHVVLDHKTKNIRCLFTLGPELGQGQRWFNSECTEKATGKKYVCRSISRMKLTSGEDAKDVRLKIKIMEHLAGEENIVNIKGTYEDHSDVHIVEDPCTGGGLFDDINNGRNYSERKAAQLTKIIVGVIDLCHSLGVMFRGLNGRTFLFVNKNPDSPLKAVNFGRAVMFQLKDLDEDQVFTDRVPSLDPPLEEYYVAPEVVNERFGPGADIWSAGLILYKLLGGDPSLWERKEVVGEAHGTAKDLIAKMLHPGPKKRLTARQVLSHPWICDNGVAPDGAQNPTFVSLKEFNTKSEGNSGTEEETTSLSTDVTSGAPSSPEEDNEGDDNKQGGGREETSKASPSGPGGGNKGKAKRYCV